MSPAGGYRSREGLLVFRRPHFRIPLRVTDPRRRAQHRANASTTGRRYELSTSPHASWTVGEASRSANVRQLGPAYSRTPARPVAPRLIDSETLADDPSRTPAPFDSILSLADVLERDDGSSDPRR